MSRQPGNGASASQPSGAPGDGEVVDAEFKDVEDRKL
jgi:hypothetical protein